MSAKVVFRERHRGGQISRRALTFIFVHETHVRHARCSYWMKIYNLHAWKLDLWHVIRLRAGFRSIQTAWPNKLRVPTFWAIFLNIFLPHCWVPRNDIAEMKLWCSLLLSDFLENKRKAHKKLKTNILFIIWSLVYNMVTSWTSQQFRLF